MNKGILSCFIILFLWAGAAEAGDLPTYDASGTWIVSESDGWTDCAGDRVKPESEIITVNQAGRVVTIHGEEGTYIGSVEGSTYLMIRSYPQPGLAGKPGIETDRITVTLTSKIRGNGTFLGTWSANDGSVSCSWGTALDLSRKTGLGNGK